MSPSRTETTWTCSACLAEMVLPNRDQPAEWFRISTAKPPMSAELTVQGDVCEECFRSFMEWFDGRRARDPR